MRRLLPLCFLLLLSGCCRQAVPVQSIREHRSTERIVDTITRTIQDSALIQALLECDSLGQVWIRELTTENGRLLNQNLSLKDNLLRVKAQIEQEQRMRQEISADTVYLRIEVPVPVEKEKVVYRMRAWQKWLLWAGVFYLARLGLKLAINWKSLTLKTLLKLF